MNTLKIRKVVRVTGLAIASILILITTSIMVSIIMAKNDRGAIGYDRKKDHKKTVFAGVNIVPIKQTDSRIDHSDNTVFTGLNIVSIDTSKSFSRQSIFVNDGVIERIEPDSSANYSGYHIIDMNGKFALPGLIDMHTHILDKSDLTQYLSYGVTTVRNMMGLPMHLRWKDQLKRENIIGSDMITASPTLNAGENRGPFHQKVTDSNKLEKLIEKYKVKGYDFIKVYNGLTEEQFRSVLRISKKNNLKVAGHPVNSVSRQEFIHSEVVSYEHIEEVFNTYMKRRIDDSLATVIANEFVDANMPICITLSAYHHLFRTATEGDAFRDSIPKEFIAPMSRFIGKRQTSGYLDLEQKYIDGITKKDAYLSKLTRIFVEQGATLLLGTDSGPNLTVAGATLHDEIMLWKEAGIPNREILKAGTINAAKVLGMENTIGQLKVGFHANIIFLERNPLKDIATLRNPNGLLFRNHYYDSQELMNLRESALKKAGWFITMGNLLEHLIFN